MDIPPQIVKTGLWKVLGTHTELASALLGLRKIASTIGAKAAEVVPDYTDHSIQHMDALWGVCDSVFLEAEISRFSVAEAFVLGSAFYVHDLGMALAATSEGLAKVTNSSEYQSARLRLGQKPDIPDARADLLAVRLAIRDLHAKYAVDLVTQHLPGIDVYLIENTDLRRSWVSHIGEVAASHHWSMPELHARLGNRIVPTDAAGQLDLAFVACALRLIDYAHVNHERASYLDRALRSEIDLDSMTHWNAQEHICGPSRRDDWLVYASTAPVTDVDAWWLLYDIARGLDAEIRGARDYTEERPSSKGRLSLRGVRGTASASQFAELVQLGGNIIPIDIRIQPESMDRLVDLLGGKALYGTDELAPLRELLQNGRDAVALRLKMNELDGVPAAPGLIEVALSNRDHQVWLSVTDNGVGMTRSVMTKHLIGIASDYWNSAEFFRDYGRAAEEGFKPIGRFGIGFLSVFMLGDHVHVETEGAAGRYLLRLRGVGRRGELVEKRTTGNRGTTVSVQLSPDKTKMLSRLESVVRARAPMLEVPVVVKWTENGSPREARVTPGWWKHLADDEMHRFVEDWPSQAWRGGEKSCSAPGEYFRSRARYAGSRSRDKHDLMEWPGLKPKLVSADRHILSSGGLGSPGILRCSRGVAVDVIPLHDMYGVLEVGEMELNAARSGPVTDSPDAFARMRTLLDELAISPLLKPLRESMKIEIVSKLDDMDRYGMLPSRFAFLRLMASLYGVDILLETGLRWVPTVEHPGNTVYRSHADVVAKLSTEARVCCGTGLGPKIAYSLLSRKMVREASQMPLITVPIDEFDVDYSHEQELERQNEGSILTGPMNDVCRTAKVEDEPLLLLSAALCMVAEAWNTTPKVLKEQEWTLDFKSNFLVAVLERPASPSG